MLTRSVRLISKPYFSYIIPTIGRASLEVAVTSVLEQAISHADFEVIVVNDSGSPLQEVEFLSVPRVRVIDTNRCERSFARNAGAAVAEGQYLAFLDDDDWILPGALENFWQLTQSDPAADWLYGGIRVVDEQGKVLKEINSRLNGNCFSKIMGGAWAPIQSSLIRSSAFFEAGGYSPFICGTEDEDLCRRIAFRGTFANTPAVIACLFRGQTWTSSTNYMRAPHDTKYSRDLILSKPGAFRRLRSSAGSSYWHGRNLRIYLSTFTWNISRRNYLTALSRISLSVLAFILSINHCFKSEFWRGVRADHVPDTLHYVIKEYEQTTRITQEG